MKISARAPFQLLVLVLFVVGCRKDDDKSIVGDLKRADTFLEGRMIYLEDLNARRFVDSCRIVNGKFSFTKTADTSGFPFRASIQYETGDSLWPYRVIGFKNPLIKGYGESSLYPEPGTIRLTLDTIEQRGGPPGFIFKISGFGEQTSAALRHFQFKAGQSPENLKHNRSLIARYPSSIDLLETLYASRAALDTGQLRALSTLFAPALRTHSTYVKIANYLRPAVDAAGFPDVRLKLPKGNFIKGLPETGKPYQLVVFWASWCVPCRREIPQLKNLHANNEGKLAMTSISIDANESQWQKALAKEGMPWPQLLVTDPAVMALLDKKYDLSAIPVWVLLDSRGRVLKRQMGYQEGEKSVEEQVELLLLGSTNPHDGPSRQIPVRLRAPE